jgi:hypothetical protein
LFLEERPLRAALLEDWMQPPPVLPEPLTFPDTRAS